MHERDYSVYVHISPSGKMYIGITHNKPEVRWKNGFGYRHQTHFFRAIQKYGWDNFYHEVLHTGLTEQEAKDMEMELIQLFTSNDRRLGYNTTLGGDGVRGYNPTPEVREKLSIANKGKVRTVETRQRIALAKIGTHPSDEVRLKMSQNHPDISGERNPMYGKNHSEETKRKISETRKRLFAKGVLVQPQKLKMPKMTPEERAKWLSEKMRGENNPSYGKGLGVIQMNLSGDKLNRYTTIREAERMTGVDHTVISRCCKGKTKTAGGFVWRYEEVENECMIPNL